MSNKFGDLLVRGIAGIGFVAILVAALLIHVNTFALLLLLVAVLGQYEFYKLFNGTSEYDVAALPFIILGALSYIALVADVLFGDYIWLIGCGITLWVIVLLSELYRKKMRPVESVSIGLFGLFYTILPLYLLFRIGMTENGYSYVLPLALFLFIWTNDTFAYIVGIAIGRHRLFERISPKKSWEGAIGGVVFSMVLASILAHYYTQLNLTQWLVFAIVAVVFGNFGDLFESLLKRSLNVKDSGNMIPGHGGILDRFDSTLMAAPMVFVYLHFCA